MLEFLAVSFTSLFVIFYLLSKDIFHPSVIVSGLWGTLLLLYCYLNHPLWDLSERFCLAISLWVFPFTCIAYLFSKIPLKSCMLSKGCVIDTKFYNRLYPYVLICNLLFIIFIIYYAGGMNFQAIRLLLVEKELPPIISLLYYINTFLSVYVLYGLLNIEHFKKRKIYIILAFLLLTAIFKSNKTGFLALFVSCLYILKVKGKFSVKYLFFSILLLVTLLVVVSLNRADYDFESDEGLLNFLYIYLLSPLTAFDVLLNGEVELTHGAWGSGVLAFFYKVLNIFSADLKLSELGTYVWVPLPTNVFTTMCGCYLDGGYFGIFLVASILGGIYGCLYAFQKRGNTVYILYYALMVSSLFFQSFGDYFFYTFSVTLQYFVFAIILSYGVKFGYKKICNT